MPGGGADAVAVVSLVLEALAVVTVWALYARVRDARARLPLAFAAAVAGFIAFTKVFSPQYLAWLVPLVVLVGGAAGVAAVALTAVALVLAQVWFFHYHALFRIEWPVWLLLARDLVLVALYARARRSADPLEDQDPVALEDEPPLGIAPQPGELDGGRQGREPVGVTGRGLVRGDPARVLQVREAEHPPSR